MDSAKLIAVKEVELDYDNLEKAQTVIIKTHIYVHVHF